MMHDLGAAIKSLNSRITGRHSCFAAENLVHTLQLDCIPYAAANHHYGPNDTLKNSFEPGRPRQLRAMLSRTSLSFIPQWELVSLASQPRPTRWTGSSISSQAIGAAGGPTCSAIFKTPSKIRMKLKTIFYRKLDVTNDDFSCCLACFVDIGYIQSGEPPKDAS